MTLTPVATGTLDKTPLQHVLLSIVNRSMSGTLAVWPDGAEVTGQDRILFHGGRPVRARLIEGAQTLERGLLPLFRRQKAPFAFYEADLCGDDALRGEVDPYALLAASLRARLRRDAVDRILERFGDDPVRFASKLVDRFRLVDKEQAFLDVLRADPRPIPELLESYGDPKIARRVLYLLGLTGGLEHYVDGRRSSVPEHVLAQQLEERIRTSTPALGSNRERVRAQIDAARAPKAPPAPAPEEFDLPGLDEEMRPSSVPGAEPIELPPTHRSAPPPAARPTPLETVAESRPSMQPPAPASSRPPTGSSRPPTGSSRPPGRSTVSPPPSAESMIPKPRNLDDATSARWDEVVAYAESIDRQTYYAMLDVPMSATASDIQKAYFQKVKTWHPDRLPKELEPLRRHAETIFHHLTEAQKTLSDETLSADYRKRVQDGGGTPESDRRIALVLDAAMEFQKAEVLLRRKDWNRAETYVDHVLEMMPDEADYLAAKAEIMFRKSGPSGMHAQGMNDLLARALDGNPEHERALMVKAEIALRLGRHREALRLYEQVAERNPKNIDAVRQVRLARMRAGESGSSSGSVAAPKSDLLGKLFGRKKK
ncbi:MAG: DnaJ domain-containing protein [Myxococcota bacterium]